MKSFLFYLFKILVIAFLIVELSGFLLLRSFRETMFYKTNHAHANSDAHYRYIILGSSRGLTSINTRKLGVGDTGFNYSMDDTGLSSHRLMLQHLVYHNISADTLFLVYENELERIDKIASSDYRFLPFVSLPYVKNYIKQKNAPGQFMLANLFPFIPLGYYNVELFFPSLYTITDRQFKYRYNDVGDYDYPVSDFRFDDLEYVEVELNFNNDELREISRICRERDVKLILLIVPAFRVNYKISGGERYEIIDLSKESLLPINFYDRIHLNKTGKDSMTRNLMKRLQK